MAKLLVDLRSSVHPRQLIHRSCSTTTPTLSTLGPLSMDVSHPPEVPEVYAAGDVFGFQIAGSQKLLEF